MSNDPYNDDLIRAYLVEREAYEVRGMKSRVAAVDAELSPGDTLGMQSVYPLPPLRRGRVDDVANLLHGSRKAVAPCRGFVVVKASLRPLPQ